MSASHTPAWILSGQAGPSSLQFVESLELPQLHDHDVLVRIHAASLNYRELVLAQGKFGLDIKPNIVPGSDGAGVVEAVGSSVSHFQPGDRVCMHLTRNVPDDAPATFIDVQSGLGQKLDGTLRRHGIFHDTSLVKMPPSLSFAEAATLTCSGLTAWNALFGLPGKAPNPGDIVLVQGTGGVSIAALQFAIASGATVIATTSSDEKAAKLTALGAHHVVNYRTTPAWGAVVKSLTPDGRGVHIVVDVGGLSTLRQSLESVRPEGMIALTGLLGDTQSAVPTILDGLTYLCITRGLLLGSRVQFDAMNRFIEEKRIKPVLDERTFTLGEVKEAFEYMTQQRHFSKVAINIS
ncbi:alcohol dehydrogenase [Aspergillus ambiguus]|uniref:zinc-dependent alcohol dehydrogenase family protein n=1 Tax=Aspergillus ambiguus TaxID=176160 RepID=UPI003CCD0BFA